MPSTRILIPVWAVAVLCAAVTPPTAAKEKPRPAAEYFGHILRGYHGSRLIVHIDEFTPDDVAAQVATAGHDGNANAIRAALGRQDAGYIKLGDKGYRIAYARRRAENGGQRIVLLIRNEITDLGRTSLRELDAPPMAADDVFIPGTGDGTAAVFGAALVKFNSSDDVVIKDWGANPLECTDLRPK